MNDKELKELDAWIAEHVMGAKWESGKKSDRMILAGEIIFMRDKNELRAIGYGIKFSPTTDPAAAMQVLEKCAEGGLNKGDFKLPVSIFRRGDLQWVVCENTEGEEFTRDYVVVEATTIPLAICLFAKQLFSKSK